MERPLISSLDHLTADQLLDTISELNKKLGVAYRMGNAHLCDQLRMAIESYQMKYQEKLKGSGGTPYDEVIDIS